MLSQWKLKSQPSQSDVLYSLQTIHNYKIMTVMNYVLQTIEQLMQVIKIKMGEQAVNLDVKRFSTSESISKLGENPFVS